jgi:hypothetical protein
MFKFALKKDETIRANLCGNTMTEQWIGSTQGKIINKIYHE